MDWTPFPQTPPPTYGYYLVTLIPEEDAVLKDYENAYIEVSFWNGSEWGDRGGDEDIIVAWGEYPEPYKG